MNKTMFILLLSSTISIANQHCLDNSWHVKKQYDYKTYHKVDCNCQCHLYKKSLDRGICWRCRHCRNPGAFNIKIVRSPQKVQKPHSAKKVRSKNET